MDLTGKHGLIFGVANDRSIAWAIAEVLHQAGATLAFTYQNERLQKPVNRLAESLGDALTLECDVSSDEAIAATFAGVAKSFGKLDMVIHSIAFAQREEFDAIFGRVKAKGILYGSGPFSLEDMKINRRGGGRGVYFKDSNEHVLELLTK